MNDEGEKMKNATLEKMGVDVVLNSLETLSFSETLIKRRSVRKYHDRPVELDLLKEIIHESTLAPSAGNEQPWKFIIVQNAQVLNNISEACKENLLARIAANSNDYAKKYEQMLQNATFNIFYSAPCLVLILGESHVKNLLFDCTLAASYFMMAAAAKGLGTCWVNFARELTDPVLLEQIGVPENHTIVAPIIIGYPVIVPPPPKRKTATILKITS